MTIRKYGTLSLEALDQATDKVKEVAADVFMNIEVGETVVRFLPSLLEGESPLRVTALHYVDVPGVPKKQVFACPKQELGLPCPVCARSAELMRSAIQTERDLGGKLSATLRVFANVLPRKSPRGGARILGFGKQLFDHIKAIRKNMLAGGDMFDPYEKGFDIIITRVGTGQNDTKYSAVACREFIPLAPSLEEIDSIMDTSHDLGAQVNADVPEAVLRFFGPARGMTALHARGPAQLPVDTTARPTASQAPLSQQTGAGFARRPAAQPSAPSAASSTTYQDDVPDFSQPPAKEVKYDDDFNVIG
jgi:hypothetical protein